MIVLLKNFTWAFANGDEFRTDWIRVPEEMQNWEMMVVPHGHLPGSGGMVEGESSFDTASHLLVGAPVSLTVAVPTPSLITQNMGPFFRLHFYATADGVVTLSVYLTQKIS